MISVTPLTDEALPMATAFMREHLNQRIAQDVWESAFRHRWIADKPNNGFLLHDDDKLAGAIGAIYSEQVIDGRSEQFCNLTSLVLLPPYRSRALDLFAHCLGQRGYHFTNFTPNAAVEKICRLLRFRELSDGEYILPHLPHPSASLRYQLLDGLAAEAALPAPVARIYRDHRDLPWLDSLVIGRAERFCLVLYRATRLRGMTAAALVHVSDPELFKSYRWAIGSHLLVRKGMVASLIDQRLLGAHPRLALRRTKSQTRFYRSDQLDERQVTNLYSELVALPL